MKIVPNINIDTSFNFYCITAKYFDNKCRNLNVSNSQTSNRQIDQKFVKDKICLIIKKNKRQIYWLHLSEYMENLLKSY